MKWPDHIAVKKNEDTCGLESTYIVSADVQQGIDLAALKFDGLAA